MPVPVRMCARMLASVSVYWSVSVCLCECVSVCLCVCASVCLCVCICVCICVCVCVCVCVWIYVCVCCCVCVWCADVCIVCSVCMLLAYMCVPRACMCANACMCVCMRASSWHLPNVLSLAPESRRTVFVEFRRARRVHDNSMTYWVFTCVRGFLDDSSSSWHIHYLLSVSWGSRRIEFEGFWWAIVFVTIRWLIEFVAHIWFIECFLRESTVEFVVIRLRIEFVVIGLLIEFVVIRLPIESVVQPIADRLAKNLEIISINFQFITRQTRILMGFIISTTLLPGTNRKSHGQNSASLNISKNNFRFFATLSKRLQLDCWSSLW